MPFYFFHWNDRLVEYIAQHGISVDDFQDVIMRSDPADWQRSRTTGRDIAFGATGDGRKIACVFEFIDKDEILPVTAFEVEL